LPIVPTTAAWYAGSGGGGHGGAFGPRAGTRSEGSQPRAWKASIESIDKKRSVAAQR
jgi:hypothetical protein